MFKQLVYRGGTTAAAMAAILFLSTAAQAKPADASKVDSVGRLDFELAKLPPANVELDLSQAMFANLFGVSDAAIAGVAETLAKSATGEHSEGTRFAADQLAAVRQVIGLASNVVREVRVRAYEKLADDLSSRFEKQLDDGSWEKIALVRKADQSARVYVVYRNNSIRGIFVIASGHGGQALVNVVCDVSPENVKNFTAAATKIGLDNGLQQVIEMKMRRMHGPVGPAGAAPPRLPEATKRNSR
jgi:hypothetical protein